MKSIKNKKGFTLTELLLTLAVVSVLIGVVLRLYMNSGESADTQVFVTDYQNYSVMVARLRGPQSYNVAGIDIDEVMASDKTGKLTTDDGSGTKVLKLAGRFEVTAVDAQNCMSTNDCYESTITGFTDQDCVNMVKGLYGSSYSISINGTTVKSNSADVIDGTSNDAITTSCNQTETSGAANEIVVTRLLNS